MNPLHHRSILVLCLVSILSCFAGTINSQVKVVYTFPAKNAIQVSAKTTIGIRYADAISKPFLKNSSFGITGSSSGMHIGTITLATDLRTVIFTPDIIFTPGEKVFVSVKPLFSKSGRMTEFYNFTFQISKSKILPNSLLAADNHSSNSIFLLSGDSPSNALPDNFPPLHITNNSNPSPGHYYLSTFAYVQSMFSPYLMILDNSGNVLYQRSTFSQGAQDFRLQPNGFFTYYDIRARKFYEMDSTFAVVDSFSAANGYVTDFHELRILPNGSYALFGMYNEQVDLRNVAGDTNATVLYYVLQEFDKEKNLIFEWRTEDSGHFAITDATHEDLTLHTIDYVHCNSIDFDPRDSTFILSSRNLDEITKIDPEDGKIIWRLGGKHNQFTILNDPSPFSHQHDVRRWPNGNITMLDNGNFRNLPTVYSRAVEYTLDEKAKTITKVWEYRHNPDVATAAMGSVLELANGNRLIGWGLCDSVAATEVHPDGTTAWEMRLPIGNYNYRMYKTVNDPIGLQDVSQITTATISLAQNYPNPFSSSTTINFTTNSYTAVQLAVFDALGREVRTLFDGAVDAGTYSAKIEAGNLPEGMYFCKLITPSGTCTKSIVLTK